MSEFWTLVDAIQATLEGGGFAPSESRRCATALGVLVWELREILGAVREGTAE